MTFNTVVVRDFENLPVDQAQWDSLVEQNETNTLFQTYDWFNCWWSVFGKPGNLFIILIYDENNVLRAIAPLCIRENTRNLVFIGDKKSDYNDFMIPDNKEKLLKIILDTIANHQDEIDSFLLVNIPFHSSTYGLLMAISNNTDYKLAVNTKILCPTMVVKNRHREIRKFINKYSIKRPFNYFQKQGTLKHEIINTIELANQHLNLFFNQHIQRWEGTPNPSLFHDDKNREFFSTLFTTLLPKKQVLFTTVMLNNKPLAYHFGFDYNSIVTWYKPSFSLEYKKKSPGILSVRYLIEYVLDNNRNELDFAIGAEPFKDRFANVYRYNVNMIFFPKDSHYARFKLVRKLKDIAKLFIKQ